MQDPWLRKGSRHGPRSWTELERTLRSLRVPKTVVTMLRRWNASPEHAEPVVRLIRDIVFTNAVYRAQLKGARWAAGTARDPHVKETPEIPGALGPVLARVERTIADLEALT